MTASAPPYRLSLRLYVVFSLLMAASATASGLVLLYLAKPFITDLSPKQAAHATVLLFTGAAAAGAFAAVGGLVVGLRFAGRIRGIVEKAEALTPRFPESPRPRVRDELGALDAAVGRLTLSLDRFVRDSDILARLPEGVLFLGPTDGLLSFNDTAESLLGLPLARYRGFPIFSESGAFPEASGNTPLAELVSDAKYGDRLIQSREAGVVTAAGLSLLLEITVQRREWGQSGTGVVLVFRDASEKRRIREEIRRADQLAFLGGMAARIAHEIRTPLATIRGLLELLQADLAAGDSRRAYIDRAVQGLDRQDRLVEHLLTLSHPEPETQEVVVIQDLIDDVLRMLPADPRLTVEPIDPALSVWGDPFRLGEVLTNLVQNALDATPGESAVELRAEALANEQVRLVVRNTGVGIPLEIQERIFQPFFTTKQRGTGLGLAIARQIVESHRGSIRVESDGRSETAFIIELPVTAPVVATGPTGSAGRRG